MDKGAPEAMFKEIFAKYSSLGISPSQISLLPSVKKITETSKVVPRENLNRWAKILVVLLGLLWYCDLSLLEVAIKTWFYLSGKDVYSEICAVSLPADAQVAFMPRFDCSACVNITEVPRVSDISAEEFEKRFAYSNIPVVVEDGATNWTAMDVFDFDFFKQLYADEGYEIECQFFPYRTEFRSLQEVLEMTPERSRQPWYVGWSNCDKKIGNILRRHYTKPYFLPPFSESVGVDWLFMGTPGYGAHMHVDHVGKPSWQAQIKGKKLWTLEAAPECFKQCRVLKVTVEPGEIIVLDTNKWYHKTEIIGDDLSITIGSEFD